MKTRLLPLLSLLVCSLGSQAQTHADRPLYDLSQTLDSRSISFENPTGERGAGGTAASEIGIGRKGAPRKTLEPGEEVTLCDIRGTGTIRHIWMTGEWMNFEWLEALPERNLLMRTTVIRAYWDGQEHPSIECPVGDLMGFAHSRITPYQSAVHSVGEKGAFNLWLPMPFASAARITLTNESDLSFPLYYQIDYTLGDAHPSDVGRLHVCFQRENPTVLTEDFEILPRRQGKGRYIGAVLGIRTLHPGWWGEGEIKIYRDGDREFPTLCGTGSEDYVGLSYGIQQTTYAYHGCNLNLAMEETVKALDLQSGERVDMHREFVSMYRWHLPDPVFWETECRITIQQIGCCYFERDDDWSAAAFWYEAVPSDPLPDFPTVAERTADLETGLW
ncbi:MAG: glycoside hydrolase family 172 protein [Bacteroidales bacterium]